MKNPKLNYLIVGTFTLIVLIGLVVTVTLLAGRTGPTDDYHAVYNNVGGVRFGTRVLYEGFPVGEIEDIVPQQGEGKTRFRIEFSVTRGWRIPSDSVAEIASSGLLAAVSINIREGKSADILKPGAEIASRESNNIMTAVGDLARDIKEMTETDLRPMMAQLHAILEGVGQMIGSDGGAPMGGDVRKMIQSITEATPDIVRNVDNFSSRLELLMSDKNLKSMDATIDNMGVSAQNMAAVTAQLGETRKSLDKLLNEVHGMVTDNKQDVQQSIVELRHTTETISRYIDSINQNLDITSRNMAEFSRSIRQNPGLLLGGTPPTDATTGKR